MLQKLLLKIKEEKSLKSDDNVDSGKSRVKVFDTIKDALAKTSMGEPFSTSKSKRLYVTTKRKWGKDKSQSVGDRVAKGFTPGSAKPGASWKDVKGYATRTSVRHGSKNSKESSKAFKK